MGLNSETGLLIQEELKVAWIAARDLKLLEEDRYHDLLINIWDSTKEEISFIFDKTGVDLADVRTAFEVFEFTMDPRLFKGFYPTICRLRINLWSMLFSPASDDRGADIAFSPGFRTAGTFVHELEHYNFLREYRMLGAPKRRQDEFEKQFGSESEKRAFAKEAEFLKRCDKGLPEVLKLYVPRHVEWASDGTPTWRVSVFSTRRSEVIAHIIKQYEDMIEPFLNRATDKTLYDRENEKIAIETHRKIANRLGVPLRIRKPKRYPIIEVRF